MLETITGVNGHTPFHYVAFKAAKCSLGHAIKMPLMISWSFRSLMKNVKTRKRIEEYYNCEVKRGRQQELGRNWVL